MDAIIYTNGESEGNPGPATVEIKIIDGSGKILSDSKEAIGNGTKIYAAYHAVFRGLQMVQEMYESKTREKEFEIRLEDEFVKKQLNNEEPVNEPGLVPMFMEIHNLRVENFPHLTVTNVKK